VQPTFRRPRNTQHASLLPFIFTQKLADRSDDLLLQVRILILKTGAKPSLFVHNHKKSAVDEEVFRRSALFGLLLFGDEL